MKKEENEYLKLQIEKLNFIKEEKERILNKNIFSVFTAKKDLERLRQLEELEEQALKGIEKEIDSYKE